MQAGRCEGARRASKMQASSRQRPVSVSHKSLKPEGVSAQPEIPTLSPKLAMWIRGTLRSFRAGVVDRGMTQCPRYVMQQVGCVTCA